MGQKSGCLNGTQKGGFLLFLGGFGLTIDTHSEIRFGDSGAYCYPDKRCNDSLLICKMSYMSNDSILNTPLPIILNPGNTSTVCGDTGWNFKLLPDMKKPSVTGISAPGKSFLRGGLKLTIVGENFDTFNVTSTGYANTTQPVAYETKTCEIFNETALVCPSPKFIGYSVASKQKRDINDEVSLGIHKKKREVFGTPILQDKFYIVVNFETYVTSNRIIEMYNDPVIIDWQSTLVFKPYKGDVYINIYGQRIDYAAAMDDYSIHVGAADCPVVEYSGTHLVCRPPQSRPDPGPTDTGDLRSLELTVGNLNFSVGKVRYEESIWEDPVIGKLIIAAIVIGGFLVISSIALLIFRLACKDQYKHLKKKVKRVRNPYLTTTDPGVPINRPFVLPDDLEEGIKAKIRTILIDSSLLTLGRELGKGQFGKVFAGRLQQEGGHDIEIAVKSLRDASSLRDVDEFLEEATIMKEFNNEHVLSLVGVSIQDNKALVLLPYMKNGDLKHYVSTPEMRFTVSELLEMGLQVAYGMQYLAGQKFVHRDLAARNCMVNADGLVKIADFGLARDIYGTEYYRVDDKSRPLPVKWMAIESMTRQKFSTASDVWSFGVTLWELVTRGMKPYAEIPNNYMKAHLQQGMRLEQPKYCPDPIYVIMLSCWLVNWEDRPTFSDIIRQIEDFFLSCDREILGHDFNGRLSHLLNQPPIDRNSSDQGYVEPRVLLHSSVSVEDGYSDLQRLNFKDYEKSFYVNNKQQFGKKRISSTDYNNSRKGSTPYLNTYELQRTQSAVKKQDQSNSKKRMQPISINEERESIPVYNDSDLNRNLDWNNGYTNARNVRIQSDEYLKPVCYNP